MSLLGITPSDRKDTCTFWALDLVTERIQNVPSGHYTWRQKGYKMSFLVITPGDRNDTNVPSGHYTWLQKGYKMSLLDITPGDRKDTKCPFWTLHLATERIQNVPS